jgi:hypothetical protein
MGALTPIMGMTLISDHGQAEVAKASFGSIKRFA